MEEHHFQVEKTKSIAAAETNGHNNEVYKVSPNSTVHKTERFFKKSGDFLYRHFFDMFTINENIVFFHKFREKIKCVVVFDQLPNSRSQRAGTKTNTFSCMTFAEFAKRTK